MVGGVDDVSGNGGKRRSFENRTFFGGRWWEVVRRADVVVRSRSSSPAHTPYFTLRFVASSTLHPWHLYIYLALPLAIAIGCIVLRTIGGID